MAQSEEFKNGEEIIKSLEKQLVKCKNIDNICEQSSVEARKEIEEHFAKLANVLAARKAVLLNEVAQKMASQKKNVEDTRIKLEKSIEVCKQALKTGTMMLEINPNAAKAIVHEITTVAIPKVFDSKITTALPNTLFELIQVHGRVDSCSRFSVAEIVTTLAGLVRGNNDGDGLNARFNSVQALCVNPNDSCLYICDYNNNAIRKTTMQGKVSTLAANENIKMPMGIAVNYSENVFFVTGNKSICKITAAGATSIFAGSLQEENADGVGTSASFCDPRGITIDQHSGTIFVSDYGNHLIRKISSQGEVSTLAGSGPGFADGNGKAAKFYWPWGICFDNSTQSLLVCDYGNYKLRRVKENGDVSTVCEVPQPTGVTITADKTIIVSTNTHTIYKITQFGQYYKTTILAGCGNEGRVDGNPDECCFKYPRGVAVHEPSHSCFVADYANFAIRKISFANPM